MLSLSRALKEGRLPEYEGGEHLAFDAIIPGWSDRQFGVVIGIPQNATASRPQHSPSIRATPDCRRFPPPCCGAGRKQALDRPVPPLA
jgi:hypothetical protein